MSTMKDKMSGDLALLSLEQTATYLEVTTAMVHTLVRSGMLEAFYPHGRKQGRYFRREDVQALVEARATKEISEYDLKTYAVRALIQSRRTEDKVNELLELLGLNASRVPTDRDSILATYIQVEDELALLTITKDEDAIEWGYRFLNMPPEYWTLVAEHTANPEPWVPFTMLCTKLIERFPEGKTYVVLKQAALSLRQSAYFYVRSIRGVREASRRFPEGYVGRITGILFNKPQP
jgi:hypothetical protein